MAQVGNAWPVPIIGRVFSPAGSLYDVETVSGLYRPAHALAQRHLSLTFFSCAPLLLMYLTAYCLAFFPAEDYSKVAYMMVVATIDTQVEGRKEGPWVGRASRVA